MTAAFPVAPFRRRPRSEPGTAERIFALLAPLLVTGALILMGLVLAPRQTRWVLGHATLSFFLAGKFIVLGGAVPGNLFSPWQLAVLITYMDTLTGVLLVYNVDFFFRIPWLGPRLRRIRLQARRVLQANLWLRRSSFIGVILFVMFPLTGTGAVGASFLGKFMGLYRFSLLGAIALGGALGSFSLAALAVLLGRERAASLLDHPLLLAGLAAVMLGLLVLLGRAFFRGARRPPAADPSKHPALPPGRRGGVSGSPGA